VDDRKITALVEFNRRGEISPYLNVISREGPEELKEELSTVVEFPLKKKITKPTKALSKTFLAILLIASMIDFWELDAPKEQIIPSLIFFKILSRFKTNFKWLNSK